MMLNVFACFLALCIVTAAELRFDGNVNTAIVRKSAFPQIPTATTHTKARRTTSPSRSLSRRHSTISSLQAITTGPQATKVIHPDVARISSWRNDYSLKMSLARKYRTYVPFPIPTGACILWDPNCKTNLTKPQAAHLFWALDGMESLEKDACFAADNSSFNCETSALNPASASLSSSVKSYMLEPRCSEDLSWYNVNYATDLDGVYQEVISDTVNTQYVQWPWGEREAFPPGVSYVLRTERDIHTSCCGQCNIYADTVDVFYWPQPGSDDSCLSIIGDEVKPQLDDILTDNKGKMFWGTITTNQYGSSGILTTATLATIDNVVIKKPVVNPWAIASRTPITSSVVYQSHNSSATQGSARSVRLQTLAIASEKNGTFQGKGSLAVSTAIIDGYTYTSPSVYVAFTDLKVRDQKCGYRGIGTVPTTILAFDPSELSTVEVTGGGGLEGHSTRPFNFQDLPCPPQSVMEANWYSPAPGYLWRPYIAIPDKLLSLDPLWHTCTPPAFFTGLDPPRTLNRATAMVKPANPIAGPPQKTETPAKPPACKDCGETNDPPLQPNGVVSDFPSPSNPVNDIQAASPTAEVNQGEKGPNELSDETIDQLRDALAPKPNVGRPRVEGRPEADERSPQFPSESGTDNTKVNFIPQDNSQNGQDNPGFQPVLNPHNGPRPQGQPNQLNAGTKGQSNVAGSSNDGVPIENVNGGSQAGNQPPPPPLPPAAAADPQPPANNEPPNPTNPNPPIQNPLPQPLPPILQVLGQTLTALLSTPGYILSSQTLLPGSPALTVNRTPYSLAPSAAALMVGSSTILLATAAPASSPGGFKTAFTADGLAFTPLNPSSVEVGHSTISLNGPAVTNAEGRVISLGSDGLAVGGSTYAFPTPTAAALQAAVSGDAAPSTMTIAGQTFTFHSSNAIVAGGATLTAGGGGTTIGDLAVSVGSAGLVVTVPFPTFSPLAGGDASDATGGKGSMEGSSGDGGEGSVGDGMANSRESIMTSDRPERVETYTTTLMSVQTEKPPAKATGTDVNSGSVAVVNMSVYMWVFSGTVWLLWNWR